MLARCCSRRRTSIRTDNHHIEVEALAHTLAVPLVRQVRETNITCKLPAHNVHVVCEGSRSFGVLRRDRMGRWRLSVSPGERFVHGVAVGRRWGRWGRTRGRGGRCAVRFCIRMLAPGRRKEVGVAVEHGNSNRCQSCIETAARSLAAACVPEALVPAD